MGTKYGTQTISGYNATPPADDGTAVEANRITWAKHKTKLTDPVKTLSEDINTALVTALDVSVVDTAIVLTTTTAHHARTINVTAGVTISLGDAATMATGYVVKIKNSHSSTITVDLATGADTLDGSAGGSTTIKPNGSNLFISNSSADGYLILESGEDSVVTGHVRAGNMQIVDGSTAASIAAFQVFTTVTENVFETVGPTGSGATNIWTDLDQIPDEGAILIVEAVINAQAAVTGQVIDLLAASGDVTGSSASDVSGIAQWLFESGAPPDDARVSTRTFIPLGSGNIFQIRWNDAANIATSIKIVYKGFLSD